MSRMKLILAALLVLGAAGAGGFTWYKRHADPIRRADAFIAQNNLRAAQIELRNAIVKQPANADNHLRLAKLEMKLADPVAAEKQFRTAAALGGDKWEIIPQLGDAMIAQSLFKDVLRQIPPSGPTPAIAAKNLLLRTVAQLGLNDVPAAAGTLAEAQRAAPNQVEVSLIAARIAAARNDFAETERRVDEALQRDPTQVEALLMKENLLTAKNDRPGALGMADRAVTSAPWSAMARIDRANQLIFAGQDDKAQADVDAVLAVQPRFSEAVYLNGVLMARHGRFADAAIQLAKLDSANVRFPQVIYYQALVASRLNQTESAAEYARRYNTLNPDDPDGRRLLAETELAAKRPDHALPVLEKAIAAGQNDAATLDLLGRTYIALNNRPAALASFTSAAGLAPENPAILAHLGLSQIQQGEPAQATSNLERSLTVLPTMPNAGEALVAAALDLNDIPKAQATLSRLRAQVGDTEMVGILGGMINVRRNDLPAAQAAFAETLRVFPGSVVAKLNLARVMVRQGRRPQGVTLMGEILAKDPANIQVLLDYLPLLAQDNQLPTVIQTLEAARKVDPKQPVLAAMLADTYTAMGNGDRAVMLLGSMAGAETLSPILLAPLARAQAASGNIADAKATYRTLLTATPNDVVARSAQVAMLLSNRDLDGARASMREALAAMPGNYRIMATMVDIEVAITGVDAGLRLADELRRDPKNLPSAALVKGDLLSRLRRPVDAARVFQAEFDAAPSSLLMLRLGAALVTSGWDDLASQKLTAWLRDYPDSPDAAQMLAQLDIKAKRLADAQVHLAMVLDKFPDNAVALNNLAWTYHLAGDSRARATAQKAYLQAPTSDAADTLGWIMAQEGATRAALPILQQSAARRPNDPAAQYHLAVALKNDGQTSEATKLLQPILQGNVDFDDKPAARKLLEELARPN